MKKPKDYLHRLIATMTPPEKRYFKMHFGQSESVLTELFDLINGQKVYDESDIKKRVSKEVGRNLKVYKVQLTEQLLKTLTLFHSKKNVTSQLRMGLEEVDLLIEKELYDIAHDRLLKLKKLCNEYQEYVYLIEIINRDMRINHIRYDKIGHSQLPIFGELKSSIEKMDEQFQFAELGNHLLDLKRKKEIIGYSAEEIEYCRKLLKSDFLQQHQQPQSLRAQMSRNSLLTFIYDILGDSEASLQHREANVAIFRANMNYAKHHSFDFLGTLRNLVNIYLRENLFEQAETIINEAINFAEKNKIHREQLVYFHYSRLHIEYSKGNLKYIVTKLEKTMVAHLEQHDITKDRIGLITFLYLAIANIFCHNHKIAQTYLRRLYEVPPDLKDYFGEIFSIVEFISHFESNDHILLSNLLQTRTRPAARKKEEAPFYYAFLKLLKKMVDSPSQVRSLAQNFLTHLEAYQKEKILGLFLYFRLENWLRALTNRTSFTEELIADNKKA